MDIFTADQVASAIGGGVTGIAALFLYLFITGRLVNPDFYKGEIDKRDKTIAEERSYSKQVVADLQELNRSVREDVVPAMTTMNNQTVMITSLIQQDMAKRSA